MVISALAKKLHPHNAQRAPVLNTPEGFLEMFGKLPEGIVLDSEPLGMYDFAHLFVKDRDTLEQFVDRVLDAILYNVLLWISYPKGGSGIVTDLNRDKWWAAMTENSVRSVTQVSVDQVRSAMRFRHPEVVGT